MNQIAFLFGETMIYWSSVVMALAVLTGIVFFWAVSIRSSASAIGTALACPLAVLLSILIGRLAHWFFLPDYYESLRAAMTDFSGTGYALLGAFAGCLLTAVLLRLLKAVRSFPGTLDCMSIGGCVAIALGRLSCFFNSEDRGDILSGVTQLPWVSPIVNTVSGLPEYRFATFFFQSILAGCLFFCLIFLFWTNQATKKYPDGDITLLFLLVYCASQIVLDSTRYDSLCLRSNGFISVVQILCALTVAFVFAFFSFRVRRMGRKLWQIFLWLLAAAGLVGAGYMEYYVQRHGDQTVFAYLVMTGCLGLVVILCVFLWQKGTPDKTARRLSTKV